MRVVAAPDGGLVVSRTAPGRGAWLCAGSLACVDLAERRRAFDRALRRPVMQSAFTPLRALAAERARLDEGEPATALRAPHQVGHTLDLRED